MKKTLLTITLITFSFIAFGQQITYGIRGCLNLGIIESSSSQTNTSKTTNNHIGSAFGAFVDFKLKNVSLQPAIILTGKGGDVTTGDGGDGQFALHYLQIPINLVYHVPVIIGNVYFGAGPYLAFGTGGTLSVNGPAGVDTQNVVYGGTGDFNTTERGLDIIGGLQFKTGLHLNYDYGLSNILNQNGPEGGLGSFKTRTFGVSIGYAF